MRRAISIKTLSLAFVAVCGCSGGASQGEQDVVPVNGFREGISPGVRDRDKAAIVDQSVDYGLALRTAALKLIGEYPTLEHIKEVKNAPDPTAAYGRRIDAYLTDGRFRSEQIAFWRDTLKLGGQKTVDNATVNMETAPTYAAMIVDQGLPFTQMFTADKGTCPRFQNGNFVAADCPNGISAVGVLTDPGVMAQFYSSMAFRRVRWLQETFICSKFPAEIGGMKQQFPGGTYYSPWDMQSISGGEAGKPGSVGRVDFRDTSSLICANCHTTMNHIAPLFGKFNERGMPTPEISVRTPIAGAPFTLMTDWLPEGQGTAWRFGQPVADLRALGQAVALDPDMPRCLVTRIWNFAMSRGDVVADQAILPREMADQLAQQFIAENYNVKNLIGRVFKSASFVRY